MPLQEENLPLIAVHGMWGTPRHFDPWVLPLLKAGYKLKAVTLPGHCPKGNTDGLSVHDYVDHVEHIVARVGPCILMGHSMGGLISRVVAGRQRNVKKLVLVCGAASRGIRSLNLDMFWRMLRNPYRHAILSGKGCRIKDIDAEDLMMNCMCGEAPADVFPSTESGVVIMELARSMIPVGPLDGTKMLVLGGVHDRMTPMKIQMQISGQHGAPLFKFDGGHLPMLEPCSKDVITHIINWLINK